MQYTHYECLPDAVAGNALGPDAPVCIVSEPISIRLLTASMILLLLLGLLPFLQRGSGAREKHTTANTLGSMKLHIGNQYTWLS